MVLTAWNVGCLPIALVIAASKARQRVRTGVVAKRQSAGVVTSGGTVAAAEGVNSKGDLGLEELGEVALMGA